MSRFIENFRRTVREAATLAWWAATFRLPRKLEERRSLNAFFDAEWYRETYPDVEASGADPLAHYLSHGASEERDPGPRFSTRGYLTHNPDVAASGENPLLHYVRFGKAEGRKITAAGSPESDYAAWIERNESFGESDLADMRRRGAALGQPAKLSVLMITADTNEPRLREAIESVRAQAYEAWELCVTDNRAERSLGKALGEYAKADQRIKVIALSQNDDAATAWNTALAQASGDWVIMLTPDGLLAPHASLEVAAAAAMHPHAQLIYSDEDEIDETGKRRNPFFKPDFSPELYHSQNYLGHLAACRSEVVRAAGGWRSGFAGAEDYDLGLRVSERIDADAIHHVPQVLYHARVAASPRADAQAAALRALTEHVARLGLPAMAEAIPRSSFYRLRFAVPQSPPLVSIIIPTRDGYDLLRRCVGSILEKTTYAPFEVLIVDNGSTDKKTLRYLAELSKIPSIRVLPYAQDFNFAAINNFAARAARGEVLALVNNDIEVISPEWLTEMVSWAAQKDIGCAGAKLYYPNGRIQHAGVILGIGGTVGHGHKYFPHDHPGYFGRLTVAQTVSAVTGACLVVRKDAFLNVDGLDEGFGVGFSDIDLCLKLREAGYRNVFTPFAELYHHEGASRGHATLAEEAQRFKDKWGALLEADPYYSPHLTRERQDFSIRT